MLDGLLQNKCIKKSSLLSFPQTITENMTEEKIPFKYQPKRKLPLDTRCAEIEKVEI